MIDFSVIPCDVNDVRDFIEKYHYSHNTNGLHISYCFKLMDGKKLIGASIFGLLGMANVWKKYVNNEKDVLELRRLVCIDKTPKNTESYFIGKMLRWIKNNTKVKKIISYSDLEHNHTGIIYRASNFKLVGKTNPGRVIIYNKKQYHDKTIRTKYKGKLKPYAQKIKNALSDGEAYYHKTKGKNVYLYVLKKEW